MSNPGSSNVYAWWSLDELSGSRYAKGVGAASSTLTVDATGVGAYKGKRSRAARFRYSLPDYMYVSSNFYNTFAITSFIVGCWVKPWGGPLGSSSMRLINKWDSSGGNKEYILYINASGYASFVWYNGSSNQVVTATNFGTLSANNWYFIMAMRQYNTSLGSYMGYVGVNDVWNSITGASGAIPGYGIDLTFGVDGGSGKSVEPFEGLIDEAFLMQREPLSTAERTWMYNSGFGRGYEDLDEEKPYSVVVEQPEVSDVLNIYVYEADVIDKPIGVIDDFHSLVWAERYNEEGDFELELPLKYQGSTLLTPGNFLYFGSSEKTMIIEIVKPIYGEQEKKLLVTGKSLESLLRKRVSKEARHISGRTEIELYRALEDSLLTPIATVSTGGTPPAAYSSDSNRQHPLFSFHIPEMLLEAEYHNIIDPMTLYDLAVEMCKVAKYGFKVIADFPNECFYFYVYEGADRSYNQGNNPWIVLSDEFGNVQESSYYESDIEKITLVYVLTDDSTYPSTEVWAYGESEPTGASRIETVLSTTINRDSGDYTLTDAQVLAIINEKGRELITNGPIKLFDGNFDIQGNFVLGVDFFLGDIVQCNLAGMETKGRIIEIVRSYSPDGRKAYLTMDYDL